MWKPQNTYYVIIIYLYIYFKILHTLYMYNLTAYLYKEVVGGIHGHGSYRKDMFLFFTYKRQSIFLWYYYIITETNLKIFSFTLVGPHHQACSNGRYILWFCWLLMKGQIFFRIERKTYKQQSNSHLVGGILPMWIR